jgi:putative addiction module component (TIGR02574 family)
MPNDSLQELADRALALPEPERWRLAQALWQSLEEEGSQGMTEEELHNELQQRLHDQPDSSWMTHEEMMAEAKRRLGCGP